MSAALDALTTPFSLSVLTATKGNASKRLIPAWVDNRPIKDPTHMLGISTGCVEHAQVAGLVGLRDLLQRITSKQALVHGVPKGSNPGDVLQLVLADKYTGAPGTVARTLACIDYPPGMRLMMCDYDPAPEAPETMASAGELVARLTGIWPAFADAGWLATTSTSSAIRDKQTQAWLKPPEGMHVYLLVTGNVTRFREHARVRLWLAGTGYCKLATPNKDTGVASILERCLVDLTVLSPERLDYVAGALIPQGALFYQDRPAPELHPGLVLDLDSLPNVTDDERAAYTQLVAEARARVAPEQRGTLRAHITSAAPTLPDAEVEKEITTRLARADRGELDASHPLYFDNGTGCTAGTLTKALDGKRLRDPLEPDYGPSQAVFHWNTGGTGWRIVSWAHGVKKVYRLAQPVPEPSLPDDGDMDDLLSRVGDTEDIDGLAAGARQDDDARGLAVRYRATRHGLIWSKPTKDGPTDVHLSNFTATISAEITEDDGAETRLRFALTAQLQGETHSLEIPAAQFASMSWVTEHLGATAIVMPGMTLKDHTRAAIQILSRDIVRRRVYTHIGWRTLGDRWCYLHAGGAIDAHGTVNDIAVAPGQALTAYQLPLPPQGDDVCMAIRASLALLDVAPDSVTLPLYAALWRAVLGGVDCSLHLSGPTGQGKTALAALIQQHWGAGMDARRLPASWSSTGNALEGLAFAAKDAVLVVDDFCPTGAKADIQRSHRDADRLFRAQGNNSGRQRMRVDSTLRPAKPPRGLILSTGEDIPRGQSLRARVLIIDVAPGIMQWDKLTPCQDNADTGVYAQTLAGFVHWLAPRYGEVMQGLPAELRALRQGVLQGGHRRTPDIVANLALGMQYFLAYAHDCGALTLDECRTYWERTWRALGDVATAQTEHHAGEEPVRRFFALLSAALTAGLAHVADASTRTDPPAIPEHWGWRIHKQRIGEDTKSEDTKMVCQPLGACIGWLHGDRLYLDPEAAFSVVQRLAESQQAPLPITQQTLWKRMHERGVLRRETGQQKNQVRRTIGGKREYVVDIPALYVQETGPSGPSGPHAAQDQQNPCVPLDLFPAWYQQKPVHSETTKPVNTTQPQAPPSWTDSDSRTGPVLQEESVHIHGLEVKQNQGEGPEGPIGPEIESREDAENTLTTAVCPCCGAAQVTRVQQHGQPACVACSLLSDDVLARMRPPMPANGTPSPDTGLPLKGQAPGQAVKATRQRRTVPSLPDAGACPTPGCPGRLKTTGKGASAVVFCRTCKYRGYVRTAPPASMADEFDEGVIV